MISVLISSLGLSARADKASEPLWYQYLLNGRQMQMLQDYATAVRYYQGVQAELEKLKAKKKHINPTRDQEIKLITFPSQYDLALKSLEIAQLDQVVDQMHQQPTNKLATQAGTSQRMAANQKARAELQRRILSDYDVLFGPAHPITRAARKICQTKPRVLPR